MKSEAEILLAIHLMEAGHIFDREVCVDTTGRKWRWDFSISLRGNRPAGWEQQIVIDIQGGTWNHGSKSHAGGKGYQNDCDKMNAAARDGYAVLHFTTEDVMTGRAIEFIKKM
jgi:hypothetical protein